MLSLINESDSVAIDDNVNTETLGILASLEEEIKYYKGLPHVNINNEFNLLTWWEKNGVDFHKLYRIGYMSSIAHANVASSTTVERLFSTACRIVTRDRVNTKPQRVETILLIHKNQDLWLRNLGQTLRNFSNLTLNIWRTYPGEKPLKFV